jgi:YggT family protein
MKPIVEILAYLLQLYSYVLIAQIIFSWLYAFGVINTRNQTVNTIGGILHKLTEPVLGPLRRLIPAINGLDISPIFAFIGIYILQAWLLRYVWYWVP